MRFYTGKRDLRLGGTPRPTISAMKVGLDGDIPLRFGCHLPFQNGCRARRVWTTGRIVPSSSKKSLS
jgi:hypothetical protein